MSELSIIIPTYNEEENIETLVQRLDTALPDIDWEAIFVDDNSPDGTANRVRALSKQDPRIVCLSRIGRRGLSSACIEGMHLARSPILAVMDADLQHDEALLADMYQQIVASPWDIIVGSRYMEGGSTGEWGMVRQFVSRVATQLGRLVVPRELTDPMSGYFMITAEAFQKTAPHLYAKGFKILLDIFASSQNDLKFKELPYTFRSRNAGESKLASNVIWDYLEFLIAKKISRFVPNQFLLFIMVGAIGVFVHLLALGLAHEIFLFPFGFAQALAIWIAMTSNFFMNNAITYRHSPLKGSQIGYGLVSFYVACAIGAVLNLSVAVFLKNLDLHWAIAGVSGGIAGAVWNFVTTRTFTWGKSS